MKPKRCKTKAEARQFAIDWQHWQSKKALSFLELLKWQAYFRKLALKFLLKREFHNEGII
jgi:hypothetical protein